MYQDQNEASAPSPKETRPSVNNQRSARNERAIKQKGSQEPGAERDGEIVAFNSPNFQHQNGPTQLILNDAEEPRVSWEEIPPQREAWETDEDYKSRKNSNWRIRKRGKITGENRAATSCPSLHPNRQKPPKKNTTPLTLPELLAEADKQLNEWQAAMRAARDRQEAPTPENPREWESGVEASTSWRLVANQYQKFKDLVARVTGVDESKKTTVIDELRARVCRRNGSVRSVEFFMSTTFPWRTGRGEGALSEEEHYIRMRNAAFEIVNLLESLQSRKPVT